MEGAACRGYRFNLNCGTGKSQLRVGRSGIFSGGRHWHVDFVFGQYRKPVVLG